MIKWFRSIKNGINVAARLALIESELREIDSKIQERMHHYSVEFEKKIQQMTFDYTKNLDDTKSDYLKRYVEVRLNCMQSEINIYPIKISSMQKEIDKITMGLEHKEE